MQSLQVSLGTLKPRSVISKKLNVKILRMGKNFPEKRDFILHVSKSLISRLAIPFGRSAGSLITY